MKHRHFTRDHFAVDGFSMVVGYVSDDRPVFQTFKTSFNGDEACRDVVSDPPGFAPKIVQLRDNLIGSIWSLNDLPDFRRQRVEPFVVGIWDRRVDALMRACKIDSTAKMARLLTEARKQGK